MPGADQSLLAAQLLRKTFASIEEFVNSHYSIALNFTARVAELTTQPKALILEFSPKAHSVPELRQLLEMQAIPIAKSVAADFTWSSGRVRIRNERLGITIPSGVTVPMVAGRVHLNRDVPTFAAPVLHDEVALGAARARP